MVAGWHNATEAVVDSLDDGDWPFVVVLPFPAKQLSPNARRDRRRVTSIRQVAISTGFFQTRAVLKRSHPWAIKRPTGKLELLATFVPAANWRYDVDNLGGRLKYYQDGIAKALGIDDAQIRRTQYELVDARKPSCVIYRLREVSA